VIFLPAVEFSSASKINGTNGSCQLALFEMDENGVIPAMVWRRTGSDTLLFEDCISSNLQNNL
jgi:hypothetical protein